MKKRIKVPPRDLVVGSIHETNNYGKIIIVKYESIEEILVRFIDTGNERYAIGDCIRKGKVKDLNAKPVGFKEGTKYKTNNHGVIEILDYKTYDHVLVKFIDTGNTKTTSVKQIEKGSVADEFDTKIGKIYPTNNNGDLKIISYINANKIEVLFIDTGNTTYTTFGQIKDGTIKDVMRPLIAGKGFVGKGDYIPRINGVLSDGYTVWRNMLIRCYDENSRHLNPTYLNCTVCEEWHNYQNFAKWFDENYIKGYHLDKDILFPNNKIYSPKTCVFVPREINNFLTEHGNKRGEYLLGVHMDKETGKYVSQVNDPTGINIKRRFLGYFYTEEEAHLVWAKSKLDILNTYIERGVLDYDKRVMKALLDRYTSNVNKAKALVGGDGEF